MRLSAVFAAAVCWTAIAQAQNPNILILVADDMGVDHVGAYGEGSNPAPTPTIDALAANGILFRNAWANAACSPTRADLLTGRYGFRTGVGFPIAQNGWALDLGEEIIPEVLDRFPTQGYKHACIGKWHLGNKFNGGSLAPNLAGFQHYAGTLGNITGALTYENYSRTVNGTTNTSTNYATTETVDDTIAWLQFVPDPWVCYVAFNAPHSPLHAPPAHLHNVTLPNVDPRNDPVPFYRAMVEAMDTEIARLFAALGPRMDNTVVIFIGDNGTPTQAAEPPFSPLKAKLTPYEGGLNVPLIISGPGIQLPGREVTALVDTTDIFPTVLELAGITMDQAFPPPSPITHDGVSMVRYLEIPGQMPIRDYVYSDLFHPNDPLGSGENRDWRMIRDERYKLIRTRSFQDPNFFQFYDLELDPWENVNLANSPMTPEQTAAATELVGVLDTLLNSGP